MSNPAKRPKNIQVRLTSEEHNAFNRAAARAGKAPSTWLRDLGLADVLHNGRVDYKGDHVPPREGDAPNPDWVNPTEVKASDVPERLEQPYVTPSGNAMVFPEKAVDATDRIYHMILNRDGKAKADAWLSQRRKPVAPVIVEPEIPKHLKPFYDSIVARDGKAAGDFWLVNQVGGKKINL